MNKISLLLIYLVSSIGFNGMAHYSTDLTVNETTEESVLSSQPIINERIQEILGHLDSSIQDGDTDAISKALIKQGVTPYQLKAYLLEMGLVVPHHFKELKKYGGIQKAEIGGTEVAGIVWLTVYAGMCFKLGLRQCFEM